MQVHPDYTAYIACKKTYDEIIAQYGYEWLKEQSENFEKISLLRDNVLIFRNRKLHNQFVNVSQKDFESSLSMIKEQIEINDKLKETHNMVYYNLPVKIFEKWRKYGYLKTPNIGYIHKGEYFILKHLLETLNLYRRHRAYNG